MVAPGAKLGDAPADAIIIFNGKDTSQLFSRKKDNPNPQPSPWVIENGELIVNGGDCWTKLEFASCQLHVEWRSDAKIQKGNSQKKGNAGVFFMDRYASQMLDCDNNPTLCRWHDRQCVWADAATGECRAQGWRVAGLRYHLHGPEAGRRQGRRARPHHDVREWVCVQNNTPIMGPTKHKQVTSYSGTFPDKAPFRFQDHKNEPPVRMRNIWVRPWP